MTIGLEGIQLVADFFANTIIGIESMKNDEEYLHAKLVSWLFQLFELLKPIWVKADAQLPKRAS